MTLLKVIKLQYSTRMTYACCLFTIYITNKIIYKTVELQSVNKSYVELIK